MIAQIDAAVASIPADYSNLWAIFAPPFSTDTSYVVGQYATYNQYLYRFKKNHTGAWSSSDADLVSIGADLYQFLRQRTGIAIADSPFPSGLLAPFKVSVEDVSFTITEGKTLMADGTIVDYNSGRISNVITLTEGELYEVRCRGIGGGGSHFFLYDKNDNLTATYAALGTEFKTFYLVATTQYKKIQMNVTTGTGTSYLHHLTLNGLKVSDEIAGVKDMALGIYEQMSYERFSVTFAYPKLIDSSGTVIDYPGGGASWSVSNEIDISNYAVVKVKAKTGYGNCYYALYDESHNCVGKLASPVGTTDTFEDFVLTNGAKYICISKQGTTTDAYVAYPAGFYDAYNYWGGKTWVCVGDSLTEANAATTKHYFDYIADETGIQPLNYGVGGTGYCNPNGTAGNFTARMASVPTDADVYTIFGSFNDYAYTINNNIPIGEPTDSGTSTVCGYINGAFDALFARVPLANLGVVAPCPWVSVNPVTSGTTAKTFAENYTNALRLCCERRSIPFLDLYHASGMRPWDSNFEELTYTKDNLHGVHPDETGHAILAPKFEAFLDSMLLH